MSETVIERQRPRYNPAVLRWARNLAGISQAEAARSISVKEEQFAGWELDPPEIAPTVRQARKLANLYKRSFLEFFRHTLPNLPDPELIPDFRLFRASSVPSSTKELKGTLANRAACHQRA